MSMQDGELVRKSIVLHLISTLTTDGWASPGDWVIESYMEPTSGPPVVAVDIPDIRFTSWEIGNSNRVGIYYVDIQVDGKTSNGMEQLAAAMQSIKQASTQAAASTRQAERSAQDLNAMARQMEQAVVRYQL